MQISACFSEWVWVWFSFPAILAQTLVYHQCLNQIHARDCFQAWAHCHLKCMCSLIGICADTLFLDFNLRLLFYIGFNSRRVDLFWHLNFTWRPINDWHIQKSSAIYLAIKTFTCDFTWWQAGAPSWTQQNLHSLTNLKVISSPKPQKNCMEFEFFIGLLKI